MTATNLPVFKTYCGLDPGWSGGVGVCIYCPTFTPKVLCIGTLSPKPGEGVLDFVARIARSIHDAPGYTQFRIAMGAVDSKGPWACQDAFWHQTRTSEMHPRNHCLALESWPRHLCFSDCPVDPTQGSDRGHYFVRPRQGGDVVKLGILTGALMQEFRATPAISCEWTNKVDVQPKNNYQSQAILDMMGINWRNPKRGSGITPHSIDAALLAEKMSRLYP